MGAASVALVYAVGARAFAPTVGLLAAAAYSVWPVALYFSSALLSEVPGTLLFLGYLLACLRFAERPSWTGSALAGALLGFAVLTRPNPLYMIPLTGIWALWQFRGDRRSICLGLAIPLFSAIAMSPWWVRNAMVFRRFIPISTMGGSVLLQGNNRIVATDPDLYGYSFWDAKIPEYRDSLRAAGDELARDQLAGRLAIEWLKANQSLWPQMAMNKIQRGWTPFLQPKTPLVQRIGTLLSWGPVLVLFLIGFFPTLIGFLRKGRPGWLLHLVVLGSLPMTILLFGELRYRFTFEPICIMIASATAVWTSQRILSSALRSPSR